MDRLVMVMGVCRTCIEHRYHHNGTQYAMSKCVGTIANASVETVGIPIFNRSFTNSFL